MQNAEIKVTVSQKFDMVVKALTECGVTEVDGINLVEFIEDRKDKATRKSTSRKEKPENANIRDAIVGALGQVDRVTLGNLTKSVNSILEEDYSTQKVGAQLLKTSALITEGVVVKSTEKGVTYFSLA